MSLLLGIKLFASPMLIGMASLAGKRWGPGAAGWMGGLPLVGGPVVWAIWISEGAATAQQVAHAAPVGVWATLIYLLSIGWLSARLPWPLMIAGGWLCYLAAALMLDASGAADSGVLGWAILPALCLAAARGLPRSRPLIGLPPLPRIELFARMLAAVILVLALTGAAHALGPELTGILAGAPVAATVIPAFTLARAGRDALLLALSGFLTGLTGFATFFLILDRCIVPIGAWATIPAVLGALAVSLAATHLVRRGRPVADRHGR